MSTPRTVMLVGLAASAALLGVSGPAVANRGNDAETVRMLDDCDPVTFNAVLGAGACVGDGDTTFSEAFEALADGGDEHWRNNPDETHVEAGEGLHVVNRGGEFHTFTRVRSFAGGGCVPEINAALGVPTRSEAFCVKAFGAVMPAGAESDVPATRLRHGHNHFQCMIHPWMTTTVEVRS